MDFDIISLLIQFPIVGMFVWFVLKNNNEWRTYLTERNSKLEKTLEKHADVLDKLVASQELHTRVLIKHFSKHEGTDLDLNELIRK